MKFPFSDAPDVATIVCGHVIDGGNPILYVSHDDDDGMWQFLCGDEHTTDDARIVSLQFVFELDHSIGELADMPCGHFATRSCQEGKWVIQKEGL